MTTGDRPGPWPVEVRRLSGGAALRLVYEDDAAFELSAEILRRMTPSAEARGHGGNADDPLPGDFSAVRILGVDPVGGYALRLRFSDGHDTGLYTFERLRELALRFA